MELQFMIGTYTNIETNIYSKDIWPNHLSKLAKPEEKYFNLYIYLLNFLQETFY